jgi:regulatory protein
MASPKAKPEVSLRARALRMLARREYSRLELERKLAAFTEDPAEISGLLADFERRGWLSEQRVVEQVTASRRRRFGAQRIVHELREKGIGEDAIAAALPALKDSELEAARTVWRKKFGVVPANARDKARQMRFLQGRGFSLEVIRRLLRDVEE